MKGEGGWSEWCRGWWAPYCLTRQWRTEAFYGGPIAQNKYHLSTSLGTEPHVEKVSGAVGGGRGGHAHRGATVTREACVDLSLATSAS